ncbi:MAG TPA: hypothetical protein VIM29_12350 [Bacillota bacterium]
MLKPLDLQTIMPRSVDVQRIQQHQNTRPIMEQQQLTQELTYLYENRQNQVEQTVAAREDSKVRPDESDNPGKRRKGSNQKRFRSKKEPREESTRPDAPAGPGQHIDIKI